MCRMMRMMRGKMMMMRESGVAEGGGIEPRSRMVEEERIEMRMMMMRRVRQWLVDAGTKKSAGR